MFPKLLFIRPGGEGGAQPEADDQQYQVCLRGKQAGLNRCVRGPVCGRRPPMEPGHVENAMLLSEIASERVIKWYAAAAEP